jgi:hypothetical protein
MAMEKTVETRSDIQRALDRFTRGEIDFQALLAALDQVFVADPAARRVALDSRRPAAAERRAATQFLSRVEGANRAAARQQRTSATCGGTRNGRPEPCRRRLRPLRAHASGATRPFGVAARLARGARPP